MGQHTSRGQDPTPALTAVGDDVAALVDGPAPRRALAAAVVELEGALGAGLGAADADPLVVLQRRWARLQRLAGRAAPGTVDPARVRFLAATLRASTPPIPSTPPTPRPATPARVRRGLRTAVAGR